MPSTRSLNATAILTAVAILALPAAASAQTHRFSAATEVTVSFKLSKGEGSGTLMRFARNRMALTRSGGALTLHASGRRAQRLALPARGGARVLVELSAGKKGSARLHVGRRTARIAGRFVAEDAVAIRTSRQVVGLHIRAAGSGHTAVASRLAAASTSPALADRSAPASTSGADAPTVAAPAPAQLFAPDSVWNAPLAAAAPLDPANSVLVKTLRDTVAQNNAAGWGTWISTSGTSPLYTVPADQPSARVTLDPGSWKVGLQQTFEAVPIPSNAAPAAGPDGHMTVWQPSTNHLWEFFQARKLADGWHASFGGAMSDTSSSPGYFTTASWPGLSQSWWGATATSLPVIAGTMMLSELRAGMIPHALAMNIPWAKPKTYSWPAQRNDGRSTDPNAIPEGARFRLDPTLDIDKLSLPPITRMMAKAAQRYGMIVRDQTGHAVSVFAENPAQYGGADPYTSPGGLYGGPNPSAVMRAFPWDRLQLLKMDLHTVN